MRPAIRGILCLFRGGAYLCVIDGKVSSAGLGDVPRFPSAWHFQRSVEEAAAARKREQENAERLKDEVEEVKKRISENGGKQRDVSRRLGLASEERDPARHLHPNAGEAPMMSLSVS